MQSLGIHDCEKLNCIKLYPWYLICCPFNRIKCNITSDNLSSLVKAHFAIATMIFFILHFYLCEMFHHLYFYFSKLNIYREEVTCFFGRVKCTTLKIATIHVNSFQKTSSKFQDSLSNKKMQKNSEVVVLGLRSI